VGVEVYSMLGARLPMRLLIQNRDDVKVRRTAKDNDAAKQRFKY
jgi:uncharacterized protein (DUF302 family)